MALCLIVSFWPPGAAAHAAGCTIAYLADGGTFGVSYVPRFDPEFGSDPSSSGEILIFDESAEVLLVVGRWQEGEFLSGEGNVLSVEIFAVPFEDLLSAQDYDSAPWIGLGEADYHPELSRWSLIWEPESPSPGNGYAIRADFVDSGGTAPPAVNAANSSANVASSSIFSDGFESGGTSDWSVP